MSLARTAVAAAAAEMGGLGIEVLGRLRQIMSSAHLTTPSAAPQPIDVSVIDALLPVAQRAAASGGRGGGGAAAAAGGYFELYSAYLESALKTKQRHDVAAKAAATAAASNYVSPSAPAAATATVGGGGGGGAPPAPASASTAAAAAAASAAAAGRGGGAMAHASMDASQQQLRAVWTRVCHPNLVQILVGYVGWVILGGRREGKRQPNTLCLILIGNLLHAPPALRGHPGTRSSIDGSFSTSSTTSAPSSKPGGG
jgi:hypothetical protein